MVRLAGIEPKRPHIKNVFNLHTQKSVHPHIGLGRLLAVQSARVLLQGPLPRHRHGQH
jgi:hypothetical protein